MSVVSLHQNETRPKNRTRLILDLLRQKHDVAGNGLARRYVYGEEVRLNTGFGPDTSLPGNHPVRIGWGQRIDAYAVDTWPSARHRRVAYEVKATRSDLRRELEQPAKQDAAMALSNEFYLVLDYDVRHDDLELPTEWGLLQVSYPQPKLGDDVDTAKWEARARLRTVVKAPWRNTEKPNFGFMLSLARNVSRL